MAAQWRCRGWRPSSCPSPTSDVVIAVADTTLQPRRSPCTPALRCLDARQHCDIVRRCDTATVRVTAALLAIAVADHERHRAVRRRLRARRVLGCARIRHRTQCRLPGGERHAAAERRARPSAAIVRGRDAGIRACVREHVAVNVRPVRRWWPWRVSRLASVVKSTVGRGDGGSSRPWPRRSPCSAKRIRLDAPRAPSTSFTGVTVTVRVTAALLRSPSLITNDTARSAVVCVPVGSSDVLEYVTARSAVCQAQRASRCRSATACRRPATYAGT